MAIQVSVTVIHIYYPTHLLYKSTLIFGNKTEPYSMHNFHESMKETSNDFEYFCQSVYRDIN